MHYRLRIGDLATLGNMIAESLSARLCNFRGGGGERVSSAPSEKTGVTLQREVGQLAVRLWALCDMRR